MGTSAWNYEQQYSGKPGEPIRRYVKYVPVGYVESHSLLVGYLLWIIGFTGAHRFYFGKPLTEEIAGKFLRIHYLPWVFLISW